MNGGVHILVSHALAISEISGKPGMLLCNPRCVNLFYRMQGIFSTLGRSKLLLIFFLFILSLSNAQELCGSWEKGETLGHLPSVIDESSGMRFSTSFSQRLYHTNDSWSQAPKFFLSDSSGGQPEEIFLEGVQGFKRDIDIEGMDVAICPQGQCIFLADIGDNLSERPKLHILITPEQEYWESAVIPRVLTLTYPDGPHDAESFAVHPNGDLYILTKEVFPIKAPPARLYRLSYDDWIIEKESYGLEYLTSIDLRSLSGSSVEVLSHIATDMDISSDGQRLLILTYGEVFELGLDVSSLVANSVFPSTIPYKKIEVVTLLQQESISYVPEAYGFIYTAEVNSSASPLLRVLCRD